MQVTKNEKFLLGILILLAFGGGNFFGYRWLAQKQSNLQLAEIELKTDQLDAMHDLQESDLWAQRQAWIHDHEPVVGDPGETHGAVFAFIKKGADDNKLEVQDETLNDVQPGAAGTRMNVSIKVKGSMQDLCKWLASLEDPNQFFAVSSFSLKADQDLKSYICQLQIARYFKNSD